MSGEEGWSGGLTLQAMPLRAWLRFASLPALRDTVEGSSTRQVGVFTPEPGCCLETDPERAE